MEDGITRYYHWLLEIGLNHNFARAVEVLSVLLIIGIVSYIVDRVSKKVIVGFIAQIVKRSKNQWDDIILKRKVFNRLAHLAPALVIHYTIYLVFNDYPKLVDFIQMVIYIYMTIVAIIVIISFLRALHDIYLHTPISKNRPIKGYIQLINILIVIVGAILIYSYITGNSVKGVLAGLGALAAVIMLVFKDTILGLVASVQLTANNMVKIGDWISMPSHNADGTVMEITLNTVKVQNWDKTISTIPTYALVSDSFANWRGMEESGGRRIMRSINIDMRSVRFCNADLLAKLKRIHFLHGYIEQKALELEEHNKKNNIDNTVVVNGRRLTNLGIFRKYIEEYLKRHPKINNDMTFLVRHLQPTDKGLPIQIYVFSRDQEWAKYEAIQADIFDHIISVIPEFELKVFQNPSGYDFEKLVH